ncbi:MAG: ribonuclease HIII [Candidatus Woesearchaeota archaeon]
MPVIPGQYKENSRKVKEALERKGFSVREIKDFTTYLQFEVHLGADKLGLLRFYASKKGTMFDDSQLKFQKDKVRSALSSFVTFPSAESPVGVLGVDEAGKGDVFGPLVVAGVFIPNEAVARKLEAIGVQDSKKVKDDIIMKIARDIKALVPSTTITINPKRYNELYEKIENLNKLLAWGHARAIENILAENHKPAYALSDQFGNERLILERLMQKGKKLELRQRPKAEQNLAVAAASILARAGFLQGMEKLSVQYHLPFPKGATHVKDALELFIKQQGKKELPNVAKMHFRTIRG